MSYEQKGVWVYLVVTTGAYLVYVWIILGEAGATPLADVAYVLPLLISLGISIGAAIVGRIVVEILSPSDDYTTDARDRQINRFGEACASWFVIGGSVVALALALVEQPWFWIANAIYLGFVLAAVVGSIIKLVAYRRGIDPSW
ncbi:MULTISPECIES: hypothetical protein [unclassified Leifsonia]|uniref:hypothetical protein n=1 Tax=unclassified Leifsonia TaxID=2663824 RepID=UPI0006FE843D|nr:MULTISPECIES: hypothetical protein [unclassified Leifsonia]KQX06581.1 hypothetical protein ASC59_01590 [Leifsonia sp. Root1293]KRA10865.1 hypothetical protein ASD61_01590 [Leifsonia sp. Root60]